MDQLKVKEADLEQKARQLDEKEDSLNRVKT